jgi:MerR family transcriptional regulator, light-induced transcriptional regulator
VTVEVSWSHEVETYLDALGRGDRRTALGQVRALRREGHDVLELISRLLAPAQMRVGELWVSDTWSVAQEHAATAISESVLSSLAVERESTVSPPPDAPTVVVSCVEQEWHALPALMLTEHLRGDGYAVSYLGANSSAQGLVRHVHELGPVAVLLSCSLSAFLPLARRQVEAVRETGTPVVVGGSAFDPEGRRARVIGATAFASAADDAGALVRSLPGAVTAAPPLTHPGAEEAYAVFREREVLADEVQRLVLRALPDPDAAAGTERSWLRVLEDQLPHVVGCVAGALVCDDPSVVAGAVDWAEVVLRHRRSPDGTGRALRSGLHDALHGYPEASRLVASLRDDVPAQPAG